MSGDDCVLPAFGLHALSRIIDDVGIDVGDPSKDDVGIAFIRESDTLSWKPFESTVCSYVYDSIRSPHILQPSVEC